ncbi:MAG: hypothetical protein CML68_06035 [Rhodobacteraceae bacterium]|nr:hypothetical protein [Paracoccaceae bacterium]
MNDAPQGGPALPDDLPVQQPGTGKRISLIWAVPILALVIAMVATWQNYASRGPLIRVWFEDAAGIRADETELRFRDIPVGLVESVEFSGDLRKVIVSIRVDKMVAGNIDRDARFWVVRPEVTTQGVRGLDTVLSGVYIQGAWDETPGGQIHDFDGLDEEPLLRADQKGTLLRLYSDTSLPAANTPIIYKGLEVGRLGQGKMSADGDRVETEAVILSPYDQLVSSSTRFWNVSGFSFTLDSGGARLDFTSIASLVAGGVTFDTLGSGGVALEKDQAFELHPDEDTAREDFLLNGVGTSVDLSMIFPENPPGLTEGAPVEMGGLKIGEVIDIDGNIDPDRFGDARVRLRAIVRINPGRLGLGDDAGAEELLDYFDLRVADGLRARLTNASILTGGLKIELVEIEGATDGSIDRTAEPDPEMPTAGSDITDMSATAQGLLARASELPIEDLMASTIGFLNAARELLGNDELQAAPAELRAALAAIRGVATSEAIQGLPDQVTGVTDDIRGVIGRVDTLLAQLDEEQAVTRLVAAIESLTNTADTLPGLVDDARGLLQDARDLPLQDLTGRASDLLASAEAILDQDSTRAIPADITAALDELRETLASVRAVTAGEEVQSLTTELADASARLNAILARIEDEDMVGNVSATLGSIDAAASSLPPLTEDARALIAQAQALPLDELSAQISDLIGAAQEIIDQGSARALPSEITAALGEMRDTLAAVRGLAEGEDIQAIPARVVALTDRLSQATEMVNGFLTTFETDGTADKITAAIDDVARTADGLPGLVDQAQGILTDAEGLPLDDLATRASTLLDAAEKILNQDSARDLPAELNGTLTSLRATLDEFRAGGVVENTNAALASARQAAEAVAEASAALPELSRRFGQLANQATTTLAGYDRTSEFSRDLVAAIRQVSAAADSIYRLSRQIERNPNSLIFGK